MNSTHTSKPPLNIALVSDFSIRSFTGGGEVRYFQLAKYLAAQGHKVTWISMKCGSSRPAEGVGETEGIDFLEIGSNVESPPKRSLHNFFYFGVTLIRHLRQYRYDIVDAQTYCPLLFSYPGTRFTQSALIATIHDTSSEKSKDFFQFARIGSAVESILYRIPYQSILTVSEATKAALVARYGRAPETVRVAHNGVALDEIDQTPNQAKSRDLIYVGRLVGHKHIDDFIELCRRTGATGAIVGHGPLEQEVSEAIALSDNIEFIGSIASHRDVLAEIKRSRVLVLPSTREGFGIVLAEAGACEVPVVAYDTGGVREVVQDGVNGFLVAPRDIESLCAAVKQALLEPTTRVMGRAGRKIVEEKFTSDKGNSVVEDTYYSAVVCQRRGRRR